MPPPGTDAPPAGRDIPARPERLLAKGRADGGGLMTPDSQSRPSRRTHFLPRACPWRAGSPPNHRRAGRQQVPPTQVWWSAFRKEVIQPQVPLRLPCYDFTPVADPTVDACLPCGLAHHLRVKPTPMV